MTIVEFLRARLDVAGVVGHLGVGAHSVPVAVAGGAPHRLVGGHAAGGGGRAAPGAGPGVVVTADETLCRIDTETEAWEHGADAARWRTDGAGPDQLHPSLPEVLDRYAQAIATGADRVARGMEAAFKAMGEAVAEAFEESAERIRVRAIIGHPDPDPGVFVPYTGESALSPPEDTKPRGEATQDLNRAVLGPLHCDTQPPTDWRTP